MCKFDFWSGNRDIDAIETIDAIDEIDVIEMEAVISSLNSHL
jgi:hypothetical protein